MTEIDELIERQWERLRSPGAWLTGPQRVAIASAARGVTNESISAALAEAAQRVYDEPATITLDWLHTIRASGTTNEEYVELVGIVAQLRAVDTFEFGMGRVTRALPEPTNGDPSGAEVNGATLDGGWVPTVGPAYPLSVLSLAPDEHDAMVDISEVLYLAPRAGEGFTKGNQHVVRDDLTRIQIEFVAARTSLVNDCFY